MFREAPAIPALFPTPHRVLLVTILRELCYHILISCQCDTVQVPSWILSTPLFSRRNFNFSQPCKYQNRADKASYFFGLLWRFIFYTFARIFFQKAKIPSFCLSLKFYGGFLYSYIKPKLLSTESITICDLAPYVLIAQVFSNCLKGKSSRF